MVFEKALSYIGYCRENNYTLSIRCSDDLTGYFIYTASSGVFFTKFESVLEWLARRYDDEKEAGNL